MKQAHPSRRLHGLPILFFAIALAATSEEIVAQQDEVWEMEEAYWRYVKAGDVEQYVSLWHEDFVGWPCETARPFRKSQIGGWVREIRDKKIRVSYELRREAVQYFPGDIAVAHYATPMIYEYPDGAVEGKGTLWKLTHTWVKVGSRWQIVGGMCGLLEERGE